MSQSNWKQRIDSLPVLGNLLAGLRGVYSLRAWRDDLRQGQQQSQVRQEALERELEQMRSSMQTRLQALEDSARQLEHVASRLKSLDDTVAARLQAFGQMQSRHADAAAWASQRVNRLEADLAHAQAGLRRLALHVALETHDELHTPPVADAAPDVRPVSLREIASTDAEHFAPFAHLLAPLREHESAVAIHLHDTPVQAWTTALRAQAGTSLAAVTALHGMHDYDAPALPDLLDAAMEALAPAGLLIVQLPNPENLAVASALLLEDPPVPAIPPARAERLARQAGFVDIRIMRLDADDPAPVLPGEGAAVERLNQWLCGPRQFALVARKAA